MAIGKCPKCGSAFGKGATFCKKCGEKLPDPDAPPVLNEAALEALEEDAEVQDDLGHETEREASLFPESSVPSKTLTIEIIEGVDKGKKFRPFPGSSLLVGTGADSDILLRDGCVSRRHALLHTMDGKFTLNDAGSTNGTFLRVAGPRELFPGDCFVLGGTVLRVVPEE